MPLTDAAFNPAFRVLRTEQIVYVKSSGARRTIYAAVTRRKREQLGDEPVRPLVSVNVENSPTLGISSAEFDSGTDSLEFPERIGGSNKVWRNLELVAHDGGALDIEAH